VRRADIVAGAVVVLTGLALLVYFIPVWVPEVLEGDYGLGARDMPRVAAITVTGLGLLFLVHQLRGQGAGADGEAEQDGPAPISKANWKFLLMCSVFLVATSAIWLFFWQLLRFPLP